MRAAFWAIAAGLAWTLGGCVFLTPPTGLAFGDAATTFPSQAPSGTQVKVYQAEDIEIAFPATWEGGVPEDPGTGASITRLIARQQTDAGLVSLTFTEVSSEAAADQAELTALVRRSMAATYDPLTVGEVEPVTLGEGENSAPAERLSYTGTPKASGSQQSWGMAYAARVRGINYVFVYAGPAGQEETLKPLFEALARLVVFKTPASASPAPAASAPASPGASPAASSPPSAGPSASPAP